MNLLLKHGRKNSSTNLSPIIWRWKETCKLTTIGSGKFYYTRGITYIETKSWNSCGEGLHTGLIRQGSCLELQRMEGSDEELFIQLFGNVSVLKVSAPLV